MAVRFSAHALSRLDVRGTSPREVEDVLERGLPDAAVGNREAKALVYPFGQLRLGRRYEQKRVRVIFVREGDDLLVITVYEYYGAGNETYLRPHTRPAVHVVRRRPRAGT